MGFKQPDLSKIKELYQQMSSNKPQQDYRWASLPDKGQSMKVRFLPPVGDMTLPFFKVVRHYGVPNPEDPSNTMNFTCFKTWDMDCPICNAINELKVKFGDDLVSDWFPSIRAYFNVLIKDNPEYVPNTPYILGMPKSGLIWFLSKMTDPDFGDITNPQTGFWITITRKSNNQLEFDIIPKPQPIASTEEEMEAISNEAFDLTKIWRQPDDEYYQTALKIAELITSNVKTKAGLTKIDQTAVSSPKEINTTTITQAQTSNQISNQTQSKSVVKPPDAPECFGQYDENSSKCLICIYELECKEAKDG